MRDPMTWAIPLFHAFGIQVKLHILYIVLTLGMIGRVYVQDPSHLGEFALIWVVMLFAIILLHEFGHCFAARRMDGDAEEILMWPLGGLAYCSVPHTPRANLITAIGGPLVNVFLCIGSGAAIAAAGYLPPINAFQCKQLYYPELHNWQTGGEGLPNYAEPPYYLDKKTGAVVFALKTYEAPGGLRFATTDDGRLVNIEAPKFDTYPTWVLWSARLFWMSWMLLLFNLIPAFPMDGGRVLQCVLWGRSGDYRAATKVACYTGLACALGFIVVSFWLNDTMIVCLAVFVGLMCFQQLGMLAQESEEGGAFGYDFSKGYGGFGPEDEENPKPRPKRVGPVKRWIQARRARRQAEEAEGRVADETRLDELLDKISRTGKDSLTPEERRFMDRVSARYRNRP